MPELNKISTTWIGSPRDVNGNFSFTSKNGDIVWVDTIDARMAAAMVLKGIL
ncbi:MAG: hypothetical protein IPK03_01065 [Bacteroidetes bacterium]|nr:hypothetical protein [Bacteroidota bacterium]